MYEKPYTFSTVRDLAHILGASLGVAAKNIPRMDGIACALTILFTPFDCNGPELIFQISRPMFLLLPKKDLNSSRSI